MCSSDLFESGIKFEAQGKQVQVALTKEQVPEVIRSLVESGVQIYSVMPVAKTLEDRFLEITNDKGEVMHA